jgi:hypothetical protein
MAAPYVAGAAAVLRQAYESIGVTEIDQDLIYQQFRETATQIYDSVTQNYYSQIDLQAAIESVLAQKPTVEEGNEETSAGENQKPESTPPTATTPEAPVEELTPSPTPEPTPAPTPEPTPEPVPQPAPEPAPAPVSGWLVDGVLSVEGTAGDDLITVDASGERFTTVTVNGASQQFEQSDIDRIEIKAGAGNDKLQINLGTTDDSVVVSEGQVLVSNDLYELDATDFATIDVHNSGGTSKLTLQDSVGDDAVHIDAAQRSGSIEMAGFGATGTGFTKVVTTSTGGNDSLTMEGTSERERFVARDARSVMRAKDFVAKGLNFESVQFVGNGGLDRAILRGTGQHDIFELSPEHATVTSVDSTVTVTDVSNIRVINRAETGESGDEVRFIGSAGDDVFVSKGERSVMRGDGYKNVARGVQTIYVDTGAGNDQASIIGSEGDDSLRVDRSTIEFESTRNLLRLVNAEVVDFAGNGGLDQIAFEEFEALDLLESLGDQATAYLRDRTISATDFDVLEAETVDEAIAEYDLEAVDYLYMLRGNWQSR